MEESGTERLGKSQNCSEEMFLKQSWLSIATLF